MNGTPAGHQRGNRAKQEQEQEDTHPQHTLHRRHISRLQLRKHVTDADTEFGTRFLGLSMTSLPTSDQLRKWSEDCWARVFSCLREYSLPGDQSMQAGGVEEEGTEQQQQMKILVDIVR